MEDTTPQTTSDFYKVSRAVDGDDSFNARVEIALELNNHPVTRANKLHIAMKVVDTIICTETGTIDTNEVTDQQITDSLTTIPDKTPIQ